MEISKKDFNRLLYICIHIDRYTMMIENYNQMQAAKARNEEYIKEFGNISGLDIQYVCEVPEITTDAELLAWFDKKGIEVQIQKRIWTEEEIKTLIQTNDKVLYGALKKLYAEQTADEQSSGETRHHNGVGFNGADSKIMSSFAEFLNKTGFLTPKQRVVARKKLIKYNKQLTRLANA